MPLGPRPISGHTKKLHVQSFFLILLGLDLPVASQFLLQGIRKLQGNSIIVTGHMIEKSRTRRYELRFPVAIRISLAAVGHGFGSMSCFGRCARNRRITLKTPVRASYLHSLPHPRRAFTI